MKRLLSALLIGFMLFSLTACGSKGEKISLMQRTYSGDDVKLSVDLYYSPESNVTVENDAEKPYKTLIKNEELNYQMEILIWEDTTFDNNKESRKEHKGDTFTEFKVGKFDSYGYEDFGGYTAFVHFEEVSETTDRYMEVRIRKLSFADDAMEGAEFFENKEIRSIVESVEYNGIVELPTEEETEKTE